MISEIRESRNYSRHVLPELLYLFTTEQPLILSLRNCLAIGGLDEAQLGSDQRRNVSVGLMAYRNMKLTATRA